MRLVAIAYNMQQESFDANYTREITHMQHPLGSARVLHGALLFMP